ncbi:MAG: D-lactate dehydrogenase VanH-A [Clostridiales Family XIII bacterium]|jgi:D-specific alpha-keto acid dehydrogenase|nr:D-lactate dehydrogenase VanH-A [Clostridiales Family XIII bacterium]
MKDIGITIYSCGHDEADAFRRLSPRFGVMPAIIADAVSEANAEAAPGNRCISVGHKCGIAAPTIIALRNAGVRYISTRSVGCDHIDVAAAEKAGIAVGNVVYSPDSVADYTLMLMLMAARNAKAIVRSAEKHDYRLCGTRGMELRDMAVGVIGAGRIGGAVIRRLRGFGCRVLAHDRRPKTRACWASQLDGAEHVGQPDGTGRLDGAEHAGQPDGTGQLDWGEHAGQPDWLDYVPLGELLRNSDIITLHLPLCAATRHIIGLEQIKAMKPGAFVVNTGRGALIDTQALVWALESGRLGGAALDVVEGEEGIFYFDCAGEPIDNRLLLKLQNMPNVIITPHTAYHTERALHDTVRKTLENCLDFERGLPHGQA